MDSQELQLHYEKIKKMYLEEKLSPKQIGEKFGVPRHKINYILEKNGIQKNVSEVKRKYTLNENYFDEIDTPNKAYILGFLYADGYNNRINNTIVLSLQRQDENILKLIRDEVGSNKPIYHHDYINSYDDVERHMSEITFASSHICDMLEKWGMPQGKTFSITFPDFLKEDLYSHFIRGYFDGDGCACITKDNHRKNNCSLHVTIMSSNELCKGIQLWLNNHDIYFNLNHPYGKDERNGILRSNNYSEIQKFFSCIYKDADLFLQRKYDKFISYFNLFKD